MKKLVYISFIFAFVLAFASCEKEVISPVFNEDGDSSTRVQGDYDYNNNEDGPQYRGGEGGDGHTGNNSGGNPDDGDIDDIDVDEDDNIVDPDEDEDFDQDENGGIVDPDEDEDFDEEDEGK